MKRTSHDLCRQHDFSWELFEYRDRGRCVHLVVLAIHVQLVVVRLLIHAEAVEHNAVSRGDGFHGGRRLRPLVRRGQDSVRVHRRDGPGVRAWRDPCQPVIAIRHSDACASAGSTEHVSARARHGAPKEFHGSREVSPRVDVLLGAEAGGIAGRCSSHAGCCTGWSRRQSSTTSHGWRVRRTGRLGERLRRRWRRRLSRESLNRLNEWNDGELWCTGGGRAGCRASRGGRFCCCASRSGRSRCSSSCGGRSCCRASRGGRSCCCASCSWRSRCRGSCDGRSCCCASCGGRSRCRASCGGRSCGCASRGGCSWCCASGGGRSCCRASRGGCSRCCASCGGRSWRCASCNSGGDLDGARTDHDPALLHVPQLVTARVRRRTQFRGSAARPAVRVSDAGIDIGAIRPRGCTGRDNRDPIAAVVGASPRDFEPGAGCDARRPVDGGRNRRYLVRDDGQDAARVAEQIADLVGAGLGRQHDRHRVDGRTAVARRLVVQIFERRRALADDRDVVARGVRPGPPDRHGGASRRRAARRDLQCRRALCQRCARDAQGKQCKQADAGHGSRQR